MAIQRFDSTATANLLAEALKQDGVVIVESLFPSSLAEAVQAEAEPILSPQEAGGGEFFGNCIKSVNAPMVNLPLFSEDARSSAFPRHGRRGTGP